MRDNSFVDHALELLEPLGPARARAMMGGHVLFCGTVPVALIADEQLYLKADASTQEAFAAVGSEPFTYEMRGKRVEMSYWLAPDGALEDPDAMLPWAKLALEAGVRAQRGKRRRKSRRPSARAPGASQTTPAARVQRGPRGRGRPRS